MPLLPDGPFALAALGIIVAGCAYVTRPDVPKAYGLAVVCVLVTVVDLAAGIFAKQTIILELGFQTDQFLAGKWWAPLTAMFVHSDFLHIFGNLFILLTAGPALEQRIGDNRFLLVYFTAGLFGWVAHTVLSFVVPNVVPIHHTAVGASGAIFGVLTCYAVRYPKTTLPMILPVTMLFVVYLPAFVVLLIFLAINVVYLIGDTFALAAGGGVAWWGHFGGFLVGLPFAYTLPKHHEAIPQPGGKGLPDPEKLAPLATTRDTRAILDQVRQFKPEARTQHDVSFALAWVDRLLDKASCPTCGAPMRREGLAAVCANGETRIEFGR